MPIDYDVKTALVVLVAGAGAWFLFGREDRNSGATFGSGYTRRNPYAGRWGVR